MEIGLLVPTPDLDRDQVPLGHQIREQGPGLRQANPVVVGQIRHRANAVVADCIAQLEAAGLDRKDLARTILQSFLRHAIRDGYFHADMHPGNLFADPRTGDIIAVDFGIMGRINRRERRFLADVVYGFITRNYRHMAERHFALGYVPAHHSIDDFALALRSIGEPLQGHTARDISMARVFGQLFTTTELFDMQTRPELVLLQKSMVIVEGVARSLDPELDVWTISEPVVGDWVRREAGPLGRSMSSARDDGIGFESHHRGCRRLAAPRRSPVAGGRCAPRRMTRPPQRPRGRIVRPPTPKHMPPLIGSYALSQISLSFPSFALLFIVSNEASITKQIPRVAAGDSAHLMLTVCA